MKAIEQNNNAVVTTAPELDLFQYTSPEVKGGPVVAKRLGTDGKTVTGVSMTPAKRKDLATALGVKSNSLQVSAEIRRQGDIIAAIGIAEIQAGIRENKLTGARFAKSKSGRLTLSAIPIEKRAITGEQLEDAYLAMTPAERKQYLANLKKLENAATTKGVTVEMETGKPARKNKKAPTPAKTAAAKTDEQPQAPEAKLPETIAQNGEVEEANTVLDNEKTQLPEATT